LMLSWRSIMRMRRRCRPNLVSLKCWNFNMEFEGCCFVPAFCATMFKGQQNFLLVRLCTYWIIWVSCVYIELCS
jgi:hypothetical protein